MSDAINDGGSAFPVHSTHALFNGNVVAVHETGMSLRDWFAGMALQGILGYLKELGIAEKNTGIERSEGAASIAYIYADAMLAARKQGGES